MIPFVYAFIPRVSSEKRILGGFQKMLSGLNIIFEQIVKSADHKKRTGGGSAGSTRELNCRILNYGVTLSEAVTASAPVTRSQDVFRSQSSTAS